MKSAFFVFAFSSVSIPLVMAQDTYILTSGSSPTCWYNPSMNRNSLTDVDLLARASDLILKLADFNLASNGLIQPGLGGPGGPPPPPGANPLPGRGLLRADTCILWPASSPPTFYYWRFAENGTNNLLRYGNCQDPNCGSGCNLYGNVSYPPQDSFRSDCSDNYYEPANISTIRPANRSVGYDRVLIKEFFEPQNVNCEGTPMRIEIVSIYDKCTRVASNSSTTLYAISNVTNTSATQNLCTDSNCTSCSTSRVYASWPISNTCSQDGGIRSKGYRFLTNTTPVVVAPSLLPTPSPTPVASPGVESSSSSSTHGLSMGATIGISIASAAVFVCLAFLASYFIKRHFVSKQEFASLGSGSKRSIVILNKSAGSRFSSSEVSADASAASARELAPADVLDIMGRPQTVSVNYEPRLKDELRLREGDQVVLESVWNDGWAQAYNITTGQRGTMAIATLDNCCA